MSSTLGKRSRAQSHSPASDSDLNVTGNGKKLRIRMNPSGRRSARQSAQASNNASSDSASEGEDPIASTSPKPQNARHLRARSTRSTGTTTHQRLSYSDKIGTDLEEDGTLVVGNQDSDNSDIVYVQKPKSRKGKSKTASKGKPTRTRNRGKAKRIESDESDAERPEPSRRSGRSTKASGNMKETMEDEEQFAEDVEKVSKAAVVASVREVFQELPAANKFRTAHNPRCDVCDGLGKNSNKGTSPLIYCQGCTTSIHRVCLGPRGQREHLVTKIGEQDFVLQCRRCIGLAKKKDKLAPRLDTCQGCHEPGAACSPFAPKLTPRQEEKLRAENDGVDPSHPQDPNVINSYDELLFRCSSCYRGFHFEHLPTEENNEEYESLEQRKKILFREYSKDFNCEQCRSSPEKVQTLVAWRPVDVSKFDPQSDTFFSFSEDEKEYLVKWDEQSYFRCLWMPGAWVWGVTATAMRNAFIRRDEQANLKPKLTTEDAIPEEFLRMEIVLDVKFDGRVTIKSEAVDKARIHEVEEVLVKFEGLSYTEAVWETPPDHDSTDPNEIARWKAFEMAYLEWVAGRHFKQPPKGLNDRIEAYRSQDFKTLEMRQQPASLTGGTMKDYQLEGLNYMLYKYHQQQNCILADEMGLGKTIQVIATIAALVKDKPKVSIYDRQDQAASLFTTNFYRLGHFWLSFQILRAPIGVAKSRLGHHHSESWHTMVFATLVTWR